MQRQLILEDGTSLLGQGFGSEKLTQGEIVFTTNMTGYQEAITDQSYCGQIITFTYPLIGNYGINREDFESISPTCKGVVVSEQQRFPSNWRAQQSLSDFLKQMSIPGISGIDTRFLAKRIRTHGSMRACFAEAGADSQVIAKKLQQTILPTNQVEIASTKTSYPCPGTGRHVVVVDFGLKHSILRELSRRNCNLTVVPYDTSAETILGMYPDGVMLTNGPGNPASLPEVLKMIQQIQGKVPIFGICLGHQLFSLANGAQTYKMRFGHRGANHPVKNIETGKVIFTSQNHGFAVNSESLKNTPLKVTHVEVNDNSIEGVQHQDYPAFSVQFHPDAAPGPHDGAQLFDQFMEMMDIWKGRSVYA